MDENKNEEKVNIRHTINAEETFTLAKDVYDVRNLLKNIYSNRAIIARRLNLLSLIISLAFTLLYVAYILCTGLLKKLSMSLDITLYCLLGVYGVLVVVLIILTLCNGGTSAKNITKYTRMLSYFRLSVRLVSLAITMAALVFAFSGDYSAQYVAIDILLIIFSIICLIVQVIPLMFGGIGKLARWLLSPVKIKYRFSKVALEWYELMITSGSESKAVKRVARKYYDDIGVCLDTFIIPGLGKKYINTIKPAQILNLVNDALEEDKLLVEGILKTIFEYATECGYVVFDPCNDLHFEGSIVEEEKKSSFKSKIVGVGKKWGLSILNRYIEKKSSDDKD